jgi:threonine/homoserine/homoserine lactone efflux protein
VTSIPIGVVNGTVIDIAARHGQRTALGVALGGAAADGLIAWLGIAGVGVALAQAPTARPVLYCVSGVVLVIVGVVVLRNTRPKVSPGKGDPISPLAGVALGLTITALNPAALLAWFAIGAWLEVPSALDALYAAMGVLVGTAIVFSGFAIGAARGLKGRPGRLSFVGGIVGALLCVLGIAATLRGIWGLLT